jgi:hypothetical protein
MSRRPAAFFAAAGFAPVVLNQACDYMADWPKTCRFPRLRGSRTCRFAHFSFAFKTSMGLRLIHGFDANASIGRRRCSGSESNLKRGRRFGGTLHSERVRGGVQARDGLDARGVAARASVVRRGTGLAAPSEGANRYALNEPLRLERSGTDERRRPESEKPI